MNGTTSFGDLKLESTANEVDSSEGSTRRGEPLLWEEAALLTLGGPPPPAVPIVLF